MQSQIDILTALCNLPTAPFREYHVQAWLKNWATQNALRSWQDNAGNLYIEYLHGPKSDTPLLIEAHMDHPGFIVVGNDDNNILHAEFRGGVKPSFFTNETVRFFLDTPNPTPSATTPYIPNGHWVETKIMQVQTRPDSRAIDIWLKCNQPLPLGTLGMWNLPDAEIKEDRFHARVCDDLAGAAAIICLLHELQSTQADAHLIAMFDRGEEVGFAGVIAACQNKWLPPAARVIGLETSSNPALIGQGPIIRVGDRSALYSTSLTHFLTQSAGFIADENSAFLYQRRLMDGGTCNSTAFAAWDFDSAAMCVALGNYHNMAPSGRIAPEFISIPDYLGMIRILVQAVHRYPKYKPGFSEMRERLLKLHQSEHITLLYNTLAETPKDSLPESHP